MPALLSLVLKGNSMYRCCCTAQPSIRPCWHSIVLDTDDYSFVKLMEAWLPVWMQKYATNKIGGLGEQVTNTNPDRIAAYAISILHCILHFPACRLLLLQLSFASYCSHHPMLALSALTNRSIRTSHSLQDLQSSHCNVVHVQRPSVAAAVPHGHHPMQLLAKPGVQVGLQGCAAQCWLSLTRQRTSPCSWLRSQSVFVVPLCRLSSTLASQQQPASICCQLCCSLTCNSCSNRTCHKQCNLSAAPCSWTTFMPSCRSSSSRAAQTGSRMPTL